jgi:protein-tyrosine phosphatase
VTQVVFVCTGNAARSVMAGVMLAAALGDADAAGTRHGAVRVSTAGTHVIEGLPVSWRTRDALGRLGLRATGHRSRQLRAEDLASADAVVGLAREHVEYVRRLHPDAADRTATLRRFARDLTADPSPLRARVHALRLGTVDLEPWEDVDDPAGGDLAAFERCAIEIQRLMDRFAAAVSPPGRFVEPGGVR